MINGVLSDTHLLYSTEDGNVQISVDTSEMNTLQRYINLMVEYNITSLWVHPKSSLSKSFEQYGDDFFNNLDIRHFKPLHMDITPFISIEDKRGLKKKTLHLILPAYLHEDFHPVLLENTNLSSLHLFAQLIERSLGVPFTRDAKGTGITLLESFYKSNDLWDIKVDKSHFYAHKQLDLQWSRPLTEKERKYKYIHLIDVNMMYFSATKNLQVGKGKCVFDNYTYFNKDRPGLWLVHLLNTTQLEANGYPPIFPSPSFQPTELIYKAKAIGYNIAVTGSYTFESKYSLFKPWYDVLEKTLEIDNYDKNNYGIIKHFIKRLCNPMIGLMGREKEDGENDKWYNRPDIYNSVVASAKATLFSALHQMSQIKIPVMYIDVDTIGYLSNKPFRDSLPDSVPISSEIGHFRHSGTYKVRYIADYCTTSIHTLKGRIKEINNNG